MTARRSAIALATTPETAQRLHRLGARTVLELGAVALDDSEFERLRLHPTRREAPLRFLSVGRLLHWKAFHLALLAFSGIDASQCEYWILGDGPEWKRLERLAETLGISAKVRFWGEVPREEVLDLLGQCDVLVHPSLHDSGGWVCLEAMAAGRPVICLDLGGPALQVTANDGVKIAAHSPSEAVRGLSEAMGAIARDPDLRIRMGQAARERIAQHYRWDRKAEQLSALYHRVLERSFTGDGSRER
jgi:glycosyltransferase involved in cell wall biosynthesis